MGYDDYAGIGELLDDNSGMKLKPDLAKPELDPDVIMYLSCGEEGGPGKVYQVNKHGHVLGVVNLPYTATGVAIHQNDGLVCALPRDGGKILRIDNRGNVETIMENDETLVHPVDVGIADNSDTIVVADNVADVLAAMPVDGGTPEVYQKFDRQRYSAQDMSVAVGRDRKVLLGTDGGEGIYRYSGSDFGQEKAPVLERRGGVAADPSTMKWAATQGDKIVVMEGNEMIQEIPLPANKTAHRQGMLSFGPASTVVVATRPKDDLEGDVWFMQFETEEGKSETQTLFKWDREPIVDFVVGPRMYWEGNTPDRPRLPY